MACPEERQADARFLAELDLEMRMTDAEREARDANIERFVRQLSQDAPREQGAFWRGLTFWMFAIFALIVLASFLWPAP